MFIVILRYTQPVERIDALLEEHRAFLAKHYAEGHFLLSGRRQPRMGGVIVARAPSEAALRAILAQDPFAQAEVAEYDVYPFEPTQFHPELTEMVAWESRARA